MSRLGDFSVPSRQLAVLSALAVVLGILGACLADILLHAIRLVTNLAFYARWSTQDRLPSYHHWGWAAVFVPVAGALVIGLIARYGSDKVRGHGIPEAIQSILEGQSIIPARLLLLKPLASAIAIGTGSPFGAEGPIIMSGGTLGSVISQYLSLAPIERRILLVAGAAAGMSATFGSPIAAVFLAVELLLFEWRPRSMIPVAVASIVAYGTRIVLLGSGPVFPVTHVHAFSVADLPWAVALGLLVGAVSGLLTYCVYAVEDAYHALPIHWMWWPALGAIVVSIGGWFVPQALGVGYPVIGAMVDGRLAFSAVFAILIVKTILWVVALSSGTSGGVLAPLLMIGGAIGALASGVIPQHDEAVWATIAMAAMLGGTMRAPFTATVFALETTHDWTLLTGVFAGAVAAMAVTVVFVKRSILTERLARRGTHVAREYAVHPLESTAVSEIMVPRERVEAIPATLPLAELRRRLGDGSAFKTHDAYPVVSDDGTLVGVIRRSVVLAQTARGERIADVAEAAVIIRPDERVRNAVDLMAKTNHRSLIVVEAHGTWIGLVDQGDVLNAWRRTVVEEESRRRVRVLPFSSVRVRTAKAAGE